MIRKFTIQKAVNGDSRYLGYSRGKSNEEDYVFKFMFANQLSNVMVLTEVIFDLLAGFLGSFNRESINIISISSILTEWLLPDPHPTRNTDALEQQKQTIFPF